MGLLANTVSLCQYRVTGPLPAGDLAAWAGERLAARGFQSIDHGAEELSVGWVHLDDSQAGDFAGVQVFQRDHWFAFTLRRDQRRVPAALLRAHLDLAGRDFLAAHPGLARIPKGKREELKEAVYGSLLARTLPAPAVFDAVWDTRSGVVSFASLSPKVCDLFEGYFKQTFDGLALLPLYPLLRAEGLVPAELQPALQAANQARGAGVLEQIRDNRWLGEELLLWLLWRTLQASGEYAVCHPGPAGAGETFAAYLNDRLTLCGDGAAGTQKITVSGPQDSFREVHAALQGGKRIREAVLTLEKGEQQWRFNLKGELFAFASYKCPAVKLEKDDLTDPTREREAVFFERMYVLEQGLQLFDSLCATFLQLRLTPAWAAESRRIEEWLAEA